MNVKRLAREPLLHFLLIGAGLFLLFGWQSAPGQQTGGRIAPESGKIIVARSDIDQMVDTFERTWQRSPTEEEVRELIESFVRDEIYYREAVAIGLDRDDSVIRRRLRMKMEFILEDISSLGDPTEEELVAYLKNHSESYREDPQISFRHVFINSDERGLQAESHAEKLLAKLEKGTGPGAIGDPILLGPEVRLLPLWDIRRRYGERFSEDILKLEPGRWQGPVRSGYGMHLVFVTEFVPARLPDIKEVRDGVERDWAVDHQRELKNAAYARLRERYAVEIENQRNIQAAQIDGASAAR